MKGEKIKASRFIAGDKVLWTITIALAVISVLVVYSSTANLAYSARAERLSYSFLRQQLGLLVILCIPLIIVVHKINCRFYGRIAVPFYWLSVGLTVLTYFMPGDINGAARWIPIGSFHFQPSEMLKIATIILLARRLASRQTKMALLRIVPSLNPRKWFTPEGRKRWREGTMPILMPVVVSCAVILPAHTSSAVIVFGVSVVMMVIGRVRMSEIAKLVAMAAALGMVYFVVDLGRSSVAGGRVSTWIETLTKDRSDVRSYELYDSERSMVAIRNGGILGCGAGQSVTRGNMTHPESDYAFAFFVEEYGLIMAAALLLLYLWIFFRAIEIFRRCGTAFPGLLVLGLALLITTQALLHIMVTLNMIPETGQPLPLVSRGGTSLIMTVGALGMILSVSRQNDENSHDRPRAESIYEK